MSLHSLRSDIKTPEITAALKSVSGLDPLDKKFPRDFKLLIKCRPDYE